MIQLIDAVFCANCEYVTCREPDCKCAHCGSDAILSLSAILNRNECNDYSAVPSEAPTSH